MRRKRKRIQNAQSRDNENFVENTSPLLNEINIEELNWIERERQAQEEWKIQQLKILTPVNEPKPPQDLILVDKVIKTVSEPPRLKLPFDLPYHNPFEPEFLDQSKSEICHFFRKTGVCRFDLRCSRLHETPLVSDTIVFLNMFTSNAMEMMERAGGDPDLCLEHDENELISEYEEFYLDVEKEFSSFGRVMTIRTCRNAMRHLRGNVYVQYRNINDAVYSFSQLNGRFYAGNRLSARFVTIDSWRESICGLYFRGKCPKGGICNFMHVLLNKGESFRDLQHFLNHSNQSVLAKRSSRQRKRSRTCSSIDETSTPEPQERNHLRNTTKKSDKSPDRRNKNRSKTRRNRSRSYKRKKEKSDRQLSKRKKSSRHHSSKEKSSRIKYAD